MKKVIIIGGGLGGLSTGVILAKNGYNVTVLEQNAQIGGCLQCFYRQKTKFETGMHFIGSADEGQILNKMLRYLEIEDQLPLSRLDTDRYNVISLEGQQFEYANGKDAFIEKMASYFPSQTDNLAKYCRVIDSIASASALHTLKDETPLNAAGTEYQLRPMDEVLEELFTDPLLQKVLAGDLPLYAAERGKTPFSVHAFIMDFYNQSSFRIIGGSDIAQTLYVILFVFEPDYHDPSPDYTDCTKNNEGVLPTEFISNVACQPTGKNNSYIIRCLMYRHSAGSCFLVILSE